jgi:uncharacterized RDD family membrane protein YckC
MKLVGVGTRVVNFLVDTAIVFLIAYVASKTWNWYVFHWRYPFFHFGWFFFGSIFVYYTIAEALFSRTVGKLVSYTKVVNRQNQRPSFVQILLRSIIRLTIVDLFFIPFIDKPLHDFASKTEVVEI